ncbi:MAG: serine/threonine-protein kinase [Pseudomonadota bacterium]
MTCPRCGTQIDDGAHFCGACGASLGATPPAARPPQGGTLPSGTPSRSPSFTPPKAQPSTNMPPARALAGQLGGQGSHGGQGGHGGVIGHFPSPAGGQPRPGNLSSSIAHASTIIGGLGINPAQVAPVDADPLIGATLNNRYLIEAKLGEGGFGAVYLGKQIQVGREVALKLLHPEMTRDPNVVARFRREGSVACNLRDAHTVTTYDFDQTKDGVLYIAMELLKGKSLHDTLVEQAPLPWQRVLRVVEQMCSSLGEAHMHGIVHRDIKPENIYLEERPGHPDFVKVLDFGIAKIVGGEFGQQSPQLTATGQTLGTLEYMSPEQLMGKQIDGRSDIYALGVVSYELLTNRLPFPDAQGPAALISAQLKKIPEAPSAVRPDARISAPVDRLILRMLEKDRERRFADAADLLAAVSEILRASNVPLAGGASAMVPPTMIAAPAVTSRPPSEQARPPAKGAPAAISRGGTAGPSTLQELEAAAGQSRRWKWIGIVLAVVVLGGLGVYFGLVL